MDGGRFADSSIAVGERHIADRAAFIAVSRDRAEYAAAPVRLGLIDPFARAGDEVPPDITRGSEGLTAKMKRQ